MKKTKLKIDSKFLSDYVHFSLIERKILESINSKSEDDKVNIDFYKSNMDPILNNFDKYNNFLLYGDVQSGKTNNLIYLIEKSSEMGYKFIINFTGTKNNVLEQNHERFFDAFDNHDEYLVIRGTKPLDIDDHIFKMALKSNKTIIISMIKTPDKIAHFTESLSILNTKFILIDDEGDDASLSYKTNTSILKMIKTLDAKFISITASPFKNLTINNFYDFYHVLESPKLYKGIEKFKNSFWKSDKTITMSLDNEQYLFDFVYQPLLEWSHRATTLKKENSQILFNSFVSIEQHSFLRDEIIFFLNDKLAHLYKNKAITFEVFDFLSKINPSRDIVISNSVISNLDYSHDHKIIIGGHNLSRGITYKHLLIEVITNSGKKTNAGTLIQKARWFGFRKNTDDIKIFTTTDIFNAFVEIEKLISLTKKYKINDYNYKEQVKNMDFKNIKVDEVKSE